MEEYFDSLDTQDPRIRDRAVFEALPKQLATAVANCAGWAEHLGGIDCSRVHTAEALQSLPIMRKSALMAAQQKLPPFGGFVDEQALHGTRAFMSPGPVWEPQLSGSDPWQGARALFAAGVRKGDRVHNTFSYHTTPGGFILDEAARALGCVVFPAGTSATDVQLDTLKTFGASAFIGTPDFLNIVLEKARAESVALPQLKRALVSGGALFPAMREQFTSAGVHVQQCYATADLGVIAYETASNGVVHPGMLLNENLIVEIVKPGSGDPVAAGEVGELVVTRAHPGYPLFRFATGDLSAFIDEPSPCGRTPRRIKGWMGRADQRTKAKGMFVDPTQMQQIRQQHKELSGVRLQISRENDRDALVLLVQKADPTDQSLQVNSDAIIESFKAITGLSCSLSVVDEALPNDGIVIEDLREYDA